MQENFRQMELFGVIRPLMRGVVKTIFLLLLIILAGCGTYRYSSSGGYDYLKPHPGRQILSDGRATYLVKEPISFRSATLTCAGNIDLDFVTTQLFNSLQSTGVFEGLELNDASARYEIIPTVVGFTDFFDNVVHLKIKFVDRHANQILYDDTFMGSHVTKTASVKALAKAMPYVASKIRRALSQASATTHQGELYSAQQVSVPQTEDAKHNARGFSLPDSTGTIQSNVTPPKFSVAEPGQRWAVVIGISAFQDSRIPSLRYASADAQAFYDWAVSPEGGKYAPARVKLLLDQQATCKQLKDALFVWLKQTLEKDMIIIYFAGYGSPESPDSPNNLFFLSYDTRYDNIPSTSFPMWDIETALKRYVKAKKVVVIVDACHSGGIGQLFDIARRANRGLKVNPINTGIQNLSNIGDGVCVISASDEKQFSQESKDWGDGHGVFTYFLLKGLKGEADYNRDNSVTLGELTLYLTQEVRRATKNVQSPTITGRYDTALTIGK